MEPKPALKKKEVSIKKEVEEKQPEVVEESSKPIEESSANPEPPPVYVEILPIPLMQPLISDEILCDILASLAVFSIGVATGYALSLGKKI